SKLKTTNPREIFKQPPQSRPPTSCLLLSTTVTTSISICISISTSIIGISVDGEGREPRQRLEELQEMTLVVRREEVADVAHLQRTEARPRRTREGFLVTTLKNDL